MSKQRKTYDVGRSAKTGRFTTVEKARRYATTHVVERVKKPTKC